MRNNLINSSIVAIIAASAFATPAGAAGCWKNGRYVENCGSSQQKVDTPQRPPRPQQQSTGSYGGGTNTGSYGGGTDSAASPRRPPIVYYPDRPRRPDIVIYEGGSGSVYYPRRPSRYPSDAYIPRPRYPQDTYGPRPRYPQDAYADRPRRGGGPYLPPSTTGSGSPGRGDWGSGSSGGGSQSDWDKGGGYGGRP